MRFPVDIQSFSEIRQGNYFYVDKTALAHQLANRYKYAFIGRPRRFGKSLLISTLQAYFEGKKELFQGLDIEQLEKTWEAYPVIRLDLSSFKATSPEQVEKNISTKLEKYEKTYNLTPTNLDLNQRLIALVERANEITGKRVVLLIDEYDAPLLDAMGNNQLFKQIRDLLRNFYSPLKSLNDQLRFVFLTGITKFSQLAIFSELNNIKNLTMSPRFAAICGITEEELTHCCDQPIREMAAANSLTYNQMLSQLKEAYDGYHFCWPSPDIYNPFSLINAFDDQRITSSWFESATPAFILEILQKHNLQPNQIGQTQCDITDFNVPPQSANSLTPLLFQTGYLTIKNYNPQTQIYTLDLPNNEVKRGLMADLLGNYMTNKSQTITLANQLTALLLGDHLEQALQKLQTVLRTVPYVSGAHTEGHYQQLLFVIFLLAGCDRLDLETHTALGRIDLTYATDQYRYIFELKTTATPADAISQITAKDYAARFALEPRKLIIVGLQFDLDQRTIKQWEIIKNEK